MKADHYDSFAESYSAENESSLLNAYYERPAMVGLAGDVDGRRILDAGCGSGPLSAALIAKGAVVTGFDSSPAMVEFNGQTAKLTFWHRPLHAMTDAFTEAGFRIKVISEPPASPDAPRELFPPHLGDRRAFLSFIFFVLEAST
ncbi:methyltransferase domain-containing protein [Sinomonas sp. P47F7]|uniref:methyltransferase domain-containing protein n=1 Tax=Sinomonas sp. P47F7 TaxID=3410987 RepID=UPI003BF58358